MAYGEQAQQQEDRNPPSHWPLPESPKVMTSSSEAPPITTWPDLARAVSGSSGIYPTTVSTLRKLEGAGRTGPKLLELIETRLRDLGLGHLPTELPVRADERVILYQRGTDAGEFVRAIQEGVAGSAGDAIIEIGRRMNRLAETGPVVSQEALRTSLADVLTLMEGGESER